MARIYWFVLMLLVMASTSARAEIYKYTDENGAVSFTNNLESVPETSRQTIEVVDESALPALTVEPTPSPPSQERNGFQRWMAQPLTKAVIALAVLTVLMLFVIRSGIGGAFLKLTVRLIFIALVGAVIYSMIMAKGHNPDPRSSEESVSSHLPNASPIHRAEKAVNDLNEKQQQQEEILQELQ